MDDQGVREGLRAWARSAGCQLCVLFGSRAGGGPVVEGDVDVAVWFAPLPSPERRLEIIGEIQDASGAHPVDVLFLHPDLDPVVRFEVFRGGEPLFEERPGLFVDEKVRALMLYEDALPLVVQVSPDVLTHLLAEEGVTPASYRQVFEEAGRRDVLPAELASRLSDAAGLRNLLVQMYDEIDYTIIAGSVGRALTDFRGLLAVLEARLEA